MIYLKIDIKFSFIKKQQISVLFSKNFCKLQALSYTSILGSLIWIKLLRIIKQINKYIIFLFTLIY